VDQRGSGRVLGVVNTVRPELGSESRIGPCEVRGGGVLLVLGGDGAEELEVSLTARVRGA
jgi:hypothetical protein